MERVLQKIWVVGLKRPATPAIYDEADKARVIQLAFTDIPPEAKGGSLLNWA